MALECRGRALHPLLSSPEAFPAELPEPAGLFSHQKGFEQRIETETLVCHGRSLVLEVDVADKYANKSRKSHLNL